MAEWGFNAFEMESIGEENLKVLYARREELRTHIQSLGLTLANFVPMLPGVVSHDEGEKEHNLKLFDMGVELAKALKAKLVMADSYEVPLKYVGEGPGYDPIHYGKNFRVQVDEDFSWEQVWENLVSAMRRMAEITARHDIPLGLEMRVGEAVSNTDAFLRLYDAVNHPNLGAIFDTAHLYAQKEILPLSIEKLKNHIVFVHAADNDGRTNAHLPPGDGSIDWVSVFQALRKHKYDGYINIDIGDCPDLEKAYFRSKEFFETLDY
jgi:sugar phosphate isomerase/epimerase